MASYIIDYTCLFISYFILVIIFGKLLKIKYKPSILNILLILSLALLNHFAASDNFLILKTITSIFSFFIICYCIFKSTLKEGIVIPLVFIVVTLISELVLMLIITIVGTVNMEYITSASYIKSLITVLTMVISYIIILINCIYSMLNKLIEFLYKRYKYILALIKIVIPIIFLFMFYLINYSGKTTNVVNIIFITTCLIVIIIFVHTIYINNTLELINELLLNNITTYEKVLDNYKLFKHNIMHNYNCIKAVGDKKVNKIIDSYIKEHKTNKYIDTDMSKIPSSLRTIIYRTLIEKYDLKINIKVDSYIKKDPISYLSSRKFCKLSQSLGIVLDNAIEACKNCDEPYIYLLITENCNELNIKVCNNFKNKINIDSIGTKTYTTKEKHNGIGLLYLNSTGFDINKTIRNNIYIIELKINK